LIQKKKKFKNNLLKLSIFGKFDEFGITYVNMLTGKSRALPSGKLEYTHIHTHIHGCYCVFSRLCLKSDSHQTFLW